MRDAVVAECGSARQERIANETSMDVPLPAPYSTDANRMEHRDRRTDDRDRAPRVGEREHRELVDHGARDHLFVSGGQIPEVEDEVDERRIGAQPGEQPTELDRAGPSRPLLLAQSQAQPPT